MIRNHKSAFMLALLVTIAVSTLLSASDGELRYLAEATVGQGGQTFECDSWSLRYRGDGPGGPFGSCAAPIIDVYVELQGASAGGITGVEFAGLIGPDAAADPGYFLFEIPNLTATTILGNAFAPPDPTQRGLNMSWSSCQNDNGRVLVETLIVIPLEPCGPGVSPPQLVLGGGQHSSPSNPLFRCPLVTLCDGPVFTKVCLGSDITTCQVQVPPFPNTAQCSTSGSFAINPDQGQGLNGCLAVGGAGNQPSELTANAQSLREELIAAIATLYDRSAGKTCEQIGAVVDRVEASILSGDVTPRHGQALIDTAAVARNKIGC